MAEAVRGRSLHLGSALPPEQGAKCHAPSLAWGWLKGKEEGKPTSGAWLYLQSWESGAMPTPQPPGWMGGKHAVGPDSVPSQSWEQGWNSLVMPPSQPLGGQTGEG